MMNMFFVVFVLGIEIKCSTSYLDSIFDQLVFYYPPEDLNISPKSSFNPLESKRQDILHEPTKEELQDYVNFLDNVSFSTCQKPPYADYETNNGEEKGRY